MRETGEKQLVQQVIVPPGWNKNKIKKRLRASENKNKKQSKERKDCGALVFQ